MEISEIKGIIKNKLSSDRYEHSIRVYKTAVELADIYKVDKERVGLAALLHDYAKNEPINTLEKYIKDVDSTLLKYDYRIWHGPAGAQLIREKLHITDEEILNAVYYHVYGRPQMSTIEKIIYLSDYIEPHRNFKGLDEVRKVAKKDLDLAVYYASKEIYHHLQKIRTSIHPNCLYVYKYYQELTKGRN